MSMPLIPPPFTHFHTDYLASPPLPYSTLISSAMNTLTLQQQCLAMVNGYRIPYYDSSSLQSFSIVLELFDGNRNTSLWVELSNDSLFLDNHNRITDSLCLLHPVGQLFQFPIRNQYQSIEIFHNHVVL